MATRIVNFQVEDDLYLRLKRFSEENGSPVSWILRKAAERWLIEWEEGAGKPRKQKAQKARTLIE
jgi:hypothetical protein